MKQVLITGASGFLGCHIVQELLKEEQIELIAIGGRPEDKANPLPSHPRLHYYPLDSLFIEEWKDIETVVNCAFARSNNIGLLSGALDFTSRLIIRLRSIGVCSVINISSQGVYKRLNAGELADENSKIEPMDVYSMAKYATERMFFASNLPFVTNVRMASINMPQRFLNHFVQKVKNNEPITITTPRQPAALIDVRDAAAAMAAIVNLNPSKRALIYNLGIGTQMTILDYALSVVEIGKRYGYQSSLIVEDNDASVGAGMDCQLINDDCGWKPRISHEDMIKELFN